MAGNANTSPASSPKRNRKWSANVMKRSNALDLEEGVLKKNAFEIARSLKRSAMRSRPREGTPYQSAMSMLNFHLNCGFLTFIENAVAE